jgi:hypothetical protein
MNQFVVSGNQTLNAVETNSSVEKHDLSTATLLMIAKARSQPTSKPVCRA